MASALTEVSTYSASVVGPDAGNAVTAASVRVMGTALANRTKYLKASYEAADAAILDIIYESGGVLTFPFTGLANSNTTTWRYDDTTGWTQWDVSGTPDRLLASIRIPTGSTITSIDVNLSGAGVHSAVPANMPRVTFRKLGAAGSFGIGAGFTDATAYPAYDSAHAVTLSGLSEVVNNATFAYVVSLRGESGANSATGLEVYNVVVHYTPVP